MHWKTLDLATGRLLSEINLDVSDNTPPRFHPDGRGVVKTVLRNGERTLLYQPLDGSAPHTLIDPVQESIYDFGWSPSGKQLAVLRGKTSSDVVMITDQGGKGKD
jgi:Tol biopolymer transport system component